MPTSGFDRIADLFDEARARPHDERPAFLRARLSDEALVAEILDLLERDERPHTVFDLEPARLLDRIAHDEASPRLPERIGPYRVIALLGEGATGVVYLVEQSDPRRLVALKLLKAVPGMRDRLRRFEQEVRLLARLRHPGIAAVHDAGRHDFGDGARPWFTMEYVEDGLPITTFAARRDLAVRDRVRLMIEACDAVTHAHQQGVIHRDLKPENILAREPATADGSTDTTTRRGPARVTILDFGIARVVSDSADRSTMHTRVGQMIGTLPYMSPEQVSGDPGAVDARSDVYALGVVLFELLTDRLPYELGDGSLPTIVRAIADGTPATLGSIDRGLRGDLDVIVRKALARDRADRYQGAAQLAEDLRRYLDGEAILARPASALYQLRTFARRNRALVTAVAAIAALLVVATVVSTSAFLAARRESRLRAQETAEAEWQTYVATIAAAHGALRAGAAADARDRLDAAPPRLRGWEWRHLDGLLRRDEVLVRMEANPRGLAFTHDETRLVVVDDAGSLSVHDARDGTRLESAPEAHAYWTFAIERHPRRDVFATAGADGVTRVWTIDPLTEIARLEREGWKNRGLAWSRDGMTLFVGAEGAVIALRPFENGAVGREFALEPHLTGAIPAVSPDGRRLVAVSELDALHAWDLDDGAAAPAAVLAAGSGAALDSMMDVVVLADGVRAAVATDRGDVQVWNLAAGRRVAQFRAHDARVNALALSPGGGLLATAGQDARIRLWETGTFRLVADLVGHTNPVRAVAFSADGARLVSGANDHTVRTWPLGRGLVDRLVGHETFVLSVDLTDDGRTAVSAGGEDVPVRVWDLRSGAPVATWSRTDDLYCSPARALDGGAQVLFARGTAIRRWTPASGATETVDLPAVAADLVVAPGERTAAVTMWRSNDVVILDLDRFVVADTLAAPPGPGPAVTVRPRLAMAPDGTMLATGAGAAIAVWDRHTGNCRRIELDAADAGTVGVRSLAFAPDASVLAVGLPGRVVCIDPATGRIVARLPVGSDDLEQDAIAFTADGSRLLAGDSHGTVRLWARPGLRPVAALRVHHQGIHAMDLSSDDAVLATASSDETVRLLRAPP